VTILRERHPFEGRSLQLMGIVKRRGTLLLLVVLPDGSRSLIPAGWTDCQSGPTRSPNGFGLGWRLRQELNPTACFLAVRASHLPVARRMATLAPGLPATALTGLDLHQLDSFEGFH
jgi:hypothetical protein